MIQAVVFLVLVAFAVWVVVGFYVQDPLGMKVIQDFTIAKPGWMKPWRWRSYLRTFDAKHYPKDES